ncbi:MAG: flavodoxin [Dehalococcoidia bacterium]|nr:flavodoxin [Dehalococcoidia bacterium]
MHRLRVIQGKWLKRSTGRSGPRRTSRRSRTWTGWRVYDLYFVGFPIQAYGPGQADREFLEKHAAGKDIVLFITHATPEEGEPLLAEWLDACQAAAAGANIVDMFHCQGELAENVAEFMKNSGDPQLSAWAEDRPDTIGQPDAARLDRARAFARRVMERYGA